MVRTHGAAVPYSNDWNAIVAVAGLSSRMPYHGAPADTLEISDPTSSTTEAPNAVTGTTVSTWLLDTVGWRFAVSVASDHCDVTSRAATVRLGNAAVVW